MKSKPYTVKDRRTGEIFKCRSVRYVDGKQYLHCPQHFIINQEKARSIYSGVKDA